MGNQQWDISKLRELLENILQHNQSFEGYEVEHDFPGPNSHFYTLAGSECDGLKQLQATTPATQKRWNFESLDFISSPPTNGTCPTGTLPVYRAYNNGFARGADSDHRLSSAAAAIQDVVMRGWINEGVVMCAPI